jgi:hypothetical protein
LALFPPFTLLRFKVEMLVHSMNVCSMYWDPPVCKRFQNCCIHIFNLEAEE